MAFFAFYIHHSANGLALYKKKKSAISVKAKCMVMIVRGEK
ncbi:hypothetical protein BTM222_14260 [Helicobacter pylori]